MPQHGQVQSPAPGGEAPHARAPEREGEEHRRGRRNRGRDRHRERREEASSAAPSLADEQRRIHELEERRQREAAGEHAEPEAVERGLPERAVQEQQAAPELPHQEFPREETARHAFPREETVRQASPREETPHGEHEAPAFRPAPIEQPRVDPKELLQDAGLVMIETDRSKAKPVAPQTEEPVHLGRPRRERPKTHQEEELQQVETKR